MECSEEWMIWKIEAFFSKVNGSLAHQVFNTSLEIAKRSQLNPSTWLEHIRTRLTLAIGHLKAECWKSRIVMAALLSTPYVNERKLYLLEPSFSRGVTSGVWAAKASNRDEQKKAAGELVVFGPHELQRTASIWFREIDCPAGANRLNFQSIAAELRDKARSPAIETTKRTDGVILECADYKQNLKKKKTVKNASTAKADFCFILRYFASNTIHDGNGIATHGEIFALEFNISVICYQ